MKRFDARLLVYNALIILLAPVLLWRKWRHLRKRHTPHEFDMARWRGDWALNAPSTLDASTPDASTLDAVRPHVVFVSTGLGEMRVTEQLDAALKRTRPDLTTTWAVRRRETIETTAREHPEQRVAFMPFDFALAVRHWRGNVRPDVVVIVEKLWTPNLIWQTRNAGGRVVVCNGISGAYLSNSLMWLNRWTLQGFDIVCLQTELEKDRLRLALPEGSDVRVCGALKLSAPAQNRDTARFESLQHWVSAQSTPLLIAGSTHEDEEEFVLRALQRVREKQACRLILAPRRPHRATDVLEICTKFEFKVSRRSDHLQSAAPPQADVLLLDTLGELGDAYGLAQAAFVGGTLNGPGHNVLEPVAHGIPVFYGAGSGPENKPPAQQACEENGVGFVVRNPEELAQGWLSTLCDAAYRDAIREQSATLFEAQRRALECNVAAIVELVDSVKF